LTDTSAELDARRGNPLAAIGRILGVAVIAVVVAFLLGLTVGPLVLPYKALVVYSGSMEPTIPVGSVVILTPVEASQVKVNDVITFQRPDNKSELVTHRVIAIESGPQGQQWVTKGDANTTADPWRVTAAGNGWRYNFNLPYIGYVLNWLQQPLGRILFLVVPAAALGLLTLYELWAPRRKPGKG
jgi:signal peptidase I